MKKHSGLKLFIIVFMAFILGGAVMFSLLKFTPLISEALSGTNTVQTITKNGTQVYEKSSLAASIEKVYDAVVVVEGYTNGQLGGTGSGFVYKTDDNYGYILTNQHVVEDFSDIKVLMSDDTEVEATKLGGDEYLDLAVLRIDKKYVTLVATLGSSEDSNLGDTIFTVGAPEGVTYRGTVTAGVLSGKDRMVSVSVSNSYSSDWVMRVLQIDASINPGNSGGPLLNVNGEVIGICSMKLVDDEIEGMGFAIPIEYAQSHIEELENGKEIEWPLLGITMANVSDTALLYRNGIQVDSSVTYGVVVVDITKGTGAAESDLKSGDVIIEMDGQKIEDTAYLRYELYQHEAGDTVEIKYVRNGKEKTTKVTLSKNVS